MDAETKTLMEDVVRTMLSVARALEDLSDRVDTLEKRLNAIDDVLKGGR